MANHANGPDANVLSAAYLLLTNYILMQNLVLLQNSAK